MNIKNSAIPKNWYIISLAISISALAGAYISQYGFDMQPCLLCLYQRIPFAVIIAISILALSFTPTKKLLNLVALIAINLAFEINALIAGFHVGVEQGWWQGFTGCSTPKFPEGITGAERLEMIRNTPFVSCTDIQFELFGISMAGYNFILCLLMGGLTMVFITFYLKNNSKKRQN